MTSGLFVKKSAITDDYRKPTTTSVDLFHKLSTEIRPSEMVGRDDRIRLITCSFEEIAESEEEDIQFSERTSLDGRSLFAVTFNSPFAERRETSPRNLSPARARKLAIPRLCRGFSDPCLRRRGELSMFGCLSPDRYEAGSNFLTLPSIPEIASS